MSSTYNKYQNYIPYRCFSFCLFVCFTFRGVQERVHLPGKILFDILLLIPVLIDLFLSSPE